jgi:Tfp pilus assembly protein PilW
VLHRPDALQVTLRTAVRLPRAPLRRLRTCERGTTLTELLVSMVLLAIIMTALVTLFTSGLTNEAQLNFQFQSQSEARVALDTMRRDIHNSCAATVTGGTTVTLLGVDSTQASYPCTVTTATWCTAASGSHFALYRAAGSATCSSTDVQRADYLTAGTIFSIVTATGELPKVGVDFTVNRRPSVTRLRYRLDDEIALRNARRT